MKRILFIDHPQFTSATNFLWHGLKELEELFPEELSIVGYPYIPTNYDDLRFDCRDLEWYRKLNEICEGSKVGAAQLPYGIPPFHAGEQVTSMDELVIQKACPWLRSFKKAGQIESEDAAVRELRDGRYDAVVLGNTHRVPTILLSRLRERVENFPPIIYYDAGERDELNEHWVHVFRPAVTFKQILTPEVMQRGLTVPIPGYTFKMYPLPLSSPIVGNDIFTDGMSIQWLRQKSKTFTKMLPVFYAMSSTWPDREAVVKGLDEVVVRNNVSRVKGCHYPQYHYTLALSQMAVTMRGSGRDTTRYWEIPLYKTAMVCDGTMGCAHPYPFEDRKTAYFYKSVPQLMELVEGHIQGKMPADAVALAGQEHLERYHSTQARSVFFLDILDRELNFLDHGLRSRLLKWKGDARWDGRPWEGPVV